MSRPPTRHSILREIRKRLGWTQTALADRIGTTTITVNRIENGSLKISKKLALRISWATGVDPADILANKSGIPQTNTGPLTKESIGFLEELSLKATEEQQELLERFAQYHTELLIKACLSASPRKLWSLQAAIRSAIGEIADQFGLSKTYKKLQDRSDSPAIYFLMYSYLPPEKQAEGNQFAMRVRPLAEFAKTLKHRRNDLPKS